jgi:hypothetical protein
MKKYYNIHAVYYYLYTVQILYLKKHATMTVFVWFIYYWTYHTFLINDNLKVLSSLLVSLPIIACYGTTLRNTFIYLLAFVLFLVVYCVT